MATFKGTATVDPNTGAFSFAPDPVSPPPPPPAPPPPAPPPPPNPPPPPAPPPSTGWTLGKPPFAPSSPWNKLIPANAVFSPALAWPSTAGNGYYQYSVAWDSYSPAVYIAKPTDPLVSVPIPLTWGWPAQTLKIRMPAEANGAQGSDGEMVVVTQDANGNWISHNFWQFKRTGANSGICSGYGSSDVNTGSGWGTTNPFRGAGIMAAACNELGGLLVQAETDAGEIMHALHLVCDAPLVKPNFIPPAIGGDGTSASGLFSEGQLLGIPKTTAMPSALTNPLAQKIWRACQNYGAYVCDVSTGNSHFGAQANAYSAATIDALWPQMQYIIPLLKRVG